MLLHIHVGCNTKKFSLPQAPRSPLIQYLLTPIGMVHNAQHLYICVCVGAEFGQANKGREC